MRREPTRVRASSRRAAALLAGAVALAGGARCALAGPGTNNPNYATGHILYVVYSPAGDELIVDLGDKSNFDPVTTCNTSWTSILRASDVTDVLGPLTPATCFYSNNACNSDADCKTPQPTPDTTDFCVVPRVAIFGVRDTTGFNSYYASKVPNTSLATSLNTVGSARGAAEVTQGFGLYANSYAPAVPSGRTNQAKWAFGNEFSYQRIGDGVEDTAGRDNERHEGALGSAIPTSIESVVPVNAGAGTVIQIPLKFGTLDPQNAGTLAAGSVGFFEVDRNGVITRYCPDADGDGIPNDGTDLCPNTSGSGVDTDGDGHGAVCDCNNSDATVWGTPADIGAVVTLTRTSAAGAITVNWPTTLDTDIFGPGTNYDVLRGRLSTKLASGVTCASNNVATTPYSEAAGTCGAPPGDGCWYLVRAQNTCGNGTYGSASEDAANNCP